jgi:hypothetical protein
MNILQSSDTGDEMGAQWDSISLPTDFKEAYNSVRTEEFTIFSLHLAHS